MSFLKYLAASLVAFLAPAHALIISVFVLVVVDLITGVWAAHKGGQSISSAGFRRTVTKLAVFELVVVCAWLVEMYMLDNVFPVSKIVASVIGLVELTSILENSNKILGQDLFKTVIAKLGSDNDSLKADIKQQIKDEVDKQLK